MFEWSWESETSLMAKAVEYERERNRFYTWAVQTERQDDELWIAQLISTLRPHSHFTSYLHWVRPRFGSNNLEKHLFHHRWNFPVGHRTGIALWSKLDNLNVCTLLDSASTPAVCPMDHPSSLLAVTRSNYPLFSHSFLWTDAQDS